MFIMLERGERLKKEKEVRREVKRVMCEKEGIKKVLRERLLKRENGSRKGDEVERRRNNDEKKEKQERMGKSV